MSTPALAQLLDKYLRDRQAGSTERLGQWFVNRYVKCGRVLTIVDTDLFHETKNSIARETIERWLERYNYHYNLPPLVERD